MLQEPEEHAELPTLLSSFSFDAARIPSAASLTWLRKMPDLVGIQYSIESGFQVGR